MVHHGGGGLFIIFFPGVVIKGGFKGKLALELGLENSWDLNTLSMEGCLCKGNNKKQNMEGRRRQGLNEDQKYVWLG